MMTPQGENGGGDDAAAPRAAWRSVQWNIPETTGLDRSDLDPVSLDLARGLVKTFQDCLSWSTQPADYLQRNCLVLNRGRLFFDPIPLSSY